jgi:3',5'-cyclic AMP phosphodiesterase CpdA
MFKLAHISDIHLGPLPKVPIRDLFSKRITGYVNWRRNRRKHLFGNTLELLIDHISHQQPDHMAITGDLVNLATKTEISTVKTWLEALGDPQNISVVPGNHDAYVPGAVGRAMLAWAPYLSGDHQPLAEEPHYPYLRRRGPVALIGCSTAVATVPFSANGYFSARQARETLNLLKKTGEEGLCRVVMIHHPPIRGAIANYKRMIGIRRFAAVLREGGAELVLHGHTHLNTLYQLQGKSGPVPVVGIASASQGLGGHKPPASYNLFSIDGGPGEWMIRRERFILDDTALGFQLDIEQTF